MDASSRLFRALADHTRRRILERLVAGPAAPGELAQRLGLPRVNISHHLGVLAEAGLIEQRRKHAAVRPEALTALRRYFDQALTVAAIAVADLSPPVSDVTQR